MVEQVTEHILFIPVIPSKRRAHAGRFFHSDRPPPSDRMPAHYIEVASLEANPDNAISIRPSDAAAGSDDGASGTTSTGRKDGVPSPSSAGW